MRRREGGRKGKLFTNECASFTLIMHRVLSSKMHIQTHQCWLTTDGRDLANDDTAPSLLLLRQQRGVQDRERYDRDRGRYRRHHGHLAPLDVLLYELELLRTAPVQAF